jgi:hypothetical protein
LAKLTRFSWVQVAKSGPSVRLGWDLSLFSGKTMLITALSES